MDYSTTKDIILKSNFISDKDATFIDENIGCIQANWEKRQIFRTETEMRISVLNDIKFPTSAAKYWQCVREQAVYYENLVTLSFDYRRNSLAQKKLAAKIAKAAGFKLESLQIDLEEAQFRQLNMEQVAKDRMREIRLWGTLMQECVNADADFDTEDVNDHQLVSYHHRFERQRVEMGTNGSPSEQANLMGQLETAARVLNERGVPYKEVPAVTMSNKPTPKLGLATESKKIVGAVTKAIASGEG